MKNKTSAKLKKTAPLNDRFFFTAPPEMTKWLYDRCEELGLYPYEYIRIVIHKAMKAK